VLITIDDGCADKWFSGYPVLRELEIPAVFFAISRKVIDGPVRLRSDQVSDPADRGCWPSYDERMTWAELRVMSAEGVVSLQSQPASQQNFAVLVTRPTARHAADRLCVLDRPPRL